MVDKYPEPVAAIFAPLFCRRFFRAMPGPLRFAWVGTSLIILLHAVPQPWRGIVDAGVVVGLSRGLVSLWHTFGPGQYPVSPEVSGMSADEAGNGRTIVIN